MKISLVLTRTKELMTDIEVPDGSDEATIKAKIEDLTNDDFTEIGSYHHLGVHVNGNLMPINANTKRLND